VTPGTPYELGRLSHADEVLAVGLDGGHPEMRSLRGTIDI
jgi:hypothetical protein